MGRLLFLFATAMALAATAHAGQPTLTLTDYMAYDDGQRQAHVMGLWDGFMVAEVYHQTQELAWLTDCGAHGLSTKEMTKAFDAYLAEQPDAAAFGVAYAFVYAMADRCPNAPQNVKDLAG